MTKKSRPPLETPGEWQFKLASIDCWTKQQKGSFGGVPTKRGRE
jgi:hypothetical protein